MNEYTSIIFYYFELSGIFQEQGTHFIKRLEVMKLNNKPMLGFQENQSFSMIHGRIINSNSLQEKRGEDSCEGRSAVVFRSNLQNYLFGLSVKFLPFSEKSQTIIKKN